MGAVEEMFWPLTYQYEYACQETTCPQADIVLEDIR